MSSTNYQPTPRLVDDAERLHELYCTQDMTVREIANHPESEVGRSTIHTYLDEHGLTESPCPLCASGVEGRDESESSATVRNSDRGVDPPSLDRTSSSGPFDEPIVAKVWSDD